MDHQISKIPKPTKDNEEWRKTFRFKERGNRASQKCSKNGDDDNDQNIYASMAYMSSNDEISIRDFGDSLQLTNWIID